MKNLKLTWNKHIVSSCLFFSAASRWTRQKTTSAPRCHRHLIWLALIQSNWNATSRLSHCIWVIRRESWSLQSWHQMPGSRGQSAYINQTELICFTAFSGVLAPAYTSFRLASSGHGGPPSRAGARWASASPLAEEYEGDREWSVNVSPQPTPPPPKCSTTRLIYATGMNSFTLGIHKYLKRFWNDGQGHCQKDVAHWFFCGKSFRGGGRKSLARYPSTLFFTFYFFFF